MGTMIHHTIIVSGQYGDYTEKAREKALEIFGLINTIDGSGSQMVSSIIESPVNGVQTFMVAPDGGKDGWDTSSRFDEAREQFIDYLESVMYDDLSSPLDWAIVVTGDVSRSYVATCDKKVSGVTAQERLESGEDLGADRPYYERLAAQTGRD